MARGSWSDEPSALRSEKFKNTGRGMIVGNSVDANVCLKFNNKIFSTRSRRPVEQHQQQKQSPTATDKRRSERKESNHYNGA